MGNSIVCAIIKRNRDMRTPINYLLVNLAVADILLAMFMAPSVFFELPFSNHPDGLTGRVLCKFLTHANIAWIGGVSSIVTFLAIAIERYYAVMYPLGNKGKLTKSKLKMIIAASWVFSLLFNIPLFLAMDIRKKKNRTYCVEIFPKRWMAMAYSLAWLFLIVLSLFGICWLMSTVVYNVEFFTTSLHIGLTANGVISDTMVLFNSAVNPFVYALLNQQFKDKMKRIICCAGATVPGVQTTRSAHDIKLTNHTTHPTHTAGPRLQE
ncbi:tachykinin-like peptides receptor 86C [Orbicella faveolata]|uniref:tachykinin-like peptides receptor 86C n=1 Tax=Orbicella faveolata TaxID=48498 RepID=UPI0009E4448D|nr:tachykinin-like peptides receptor 86C [Orbicella faveolata]